MTQADVALDLTPQGPRKTPPTKRRQEAQYISPQDEAGTAIACVDTYLKIARKYDLNSALVEKYKHVSLEKMITEYQKKRVSEEELSWLRNAVLFKVFFMIPYALKKFFRVPRHLINDATQNLVVKILEAMEVFKPSLGYKFQNYLYGYVFSGIAQTFQDTNIVRLPDSRRKILKEHCECTTQRTEDDQPDSPLPTYHSATSCPADIDDYDEVVHNRQLTDWLQEAMSSEAGLLSADERRVLIMHYGLFGAKQCTYQEIAALHKAEGKGHACSRMSQINTAALKKLRAFFKDAGLEEY